MPGLSQICLADRARGRAGTGRGHGGMPRVWCVGVRGRLLRGGVLEEEGRRGGRESLDVGRSWIVLLRVMGKVGFGVGNVW